MTKLQKVSVVSIVIALEILGGCLWKYLSERNADNYDILYFILSIVSTVILTIVIANVIKTNRKRREISIGQNGKRELFFEMLTCAVMVYVHGRVFFKTMSVPDAGSFYMPWHSKNSAEWFTFFFACICVFECRLFIKKIYNDQIKRMSLIPLYLFLAAISAYSLYQPNCFNTRYNVYHSHAYFNSVYRVLKLQPYNHVNTGVYGFYGIILAPLTKLFGSDFRACIMALMVLTFFSLLCYFYVLEKLTDCTILKVLGAICIITPFTSLTSNIYLQLLPHRILFVGYILAFIVRKHKNSSYTKLYILSGYIIMALAVVWNFETGLACVLAYFGSEIVYELQRSALNDFVFWKKVLYNIIQIPLLIIFAWVLVNCYNMIVSRSFVSFKVFLFPFIGNEYVGNLNISLSTFSSAWMLVLGLIIFSVCVIVMSTNLSGAPYQNKELVCLSALVISVSIQMTYFINRSVYGNLYIVLPVMSLILVFWVNYFMNKRIWSLNELCNGCARALCTVFLTSMLLVNLMAVCRYFQLDTEREGGRNMEEIDDFKRVISEQIPKDTLGIGWGIPEIYSYLGWDTGFYGIDMSDFGVLPNEEKNLIFEIVNHSDDLLINTENLNKMREYGQIEYFFETHDLADNIVCGPISLEYYVKNRSEEIEYGIEW